jgi:hypothetical protein
MSLGDMTTKQKIDSIAWLMQFPAITVMVFLRRKIGYRQLSPTKLVIMALVLFFGPRVMNTFLGTFTFGVVTVRADGLIWQLLFAVVMLIVGLVQRQLRWRAIRKGIRWHTYSRGVSWFDFLPIRQDLIYRVIDPVVGCAVGWVISDMLSPALGTWIMFSSLALWFLEQYSYDKQLDHALDNLDSLVEADVHSELVQHFTQGPAVAKQRHHLTETAGIPTGLGPDVERLIAQRQSRPAVARE